MKEGSEKHERPEGHEEDPLKLPPPGPGMKRLSVALFFLAGLALARL